METRGLGQSQDIGGSIVSRHHRRRRVGTAKNGRRPTHRRLGQGNGGGAQDPQGSPKSVGCSVGDQHLCETLPTQRSSRLDAPQHSQVCVEDLGQTSRLPQYNPEKLASFSRFGDAPSRAKSCCGFKADRSLEPKITMDVYAHALSGWQQDAAEAFAEVMKPAA